MDAVDSTGGWCILLNEKLAGSWQIPQMLRNLECIIPMIQVMSVQVLLNNSLP